MCLPLFLSSDNHVNVVPYVTSQIAQKPPHVNVYASLRDRLSNPCLHLPMIPKPRYLRVRSLWLCRAVRCGLCHQTARQSPDKWRPPVWPGTPEWPHLPNYHTPGRCWWLGGFSVWVVRGGLYSWNITGNSQSTSIGNCLMDHLPVLLFVILHGRRARERV